MWEKIFLDNGQFVNYSQEHYLSFVIFFVLGLGFIFWGRSLKSHEAKQKLWLCLCIFLWLVQYGKVLIRYLLGVFDPLRDFPLELCNMLPVFMCIMIWKGSRKWWAILFFWIMAGTLQSNFTPTLKDSFPHYEYFRYWLIHMWLPMAAVYGVFVFDYRVDIKDGFRAFLWLHAVAYPMMLVNYFLGANYMFMQGKPDGKTIYDLLADWPWYLLQLEVVMWILIIIILIPFWIEKALNKNSVKREG